MKCILCKICESANAAVRNSTLAWMDTQINKMALWEQEADQERILHADSLRETDPVQSFEEYFALAEQGSVWSMVPVGIDFEFGRGVPQNLQQAEAWYRRAYERGSDYGLLESGGFIVSQSASRKQRRFLGPASSEASRLPCSHWRGVI